MDNNEKNLNTLLQYLHDSYNGLMECAEKASDPILNKYLLNIALNRQLFIAELEAAFTTLNIEPVHKGTLLGPLHRLFIDIKAMLVDNNADTLKYEILRGDETLIGAYNAALMHEKHENMKEILNRQLQHIHLALVRVTETIEA